MNYRIIILMLIGGKLFAASNQLPPVPSRELAAAIINYRYDGSGIDAIKKLAQSVPIDEYHIRLAAGKRCPIEALKVLVAQGKGVLNFRRPTTPVYQDYGLEAVRWDPLTCYVVNEENGINLPALAHILANDADPNATSTYATPQWLQLPHEGDTALHWVAHFANRYFDRHGQICQQAAEILLAKANPKLKNAEGKMPWQVIEKGRAPKFKTLLKDAADSYQNPAPST